MPYSPIVLVLFGVLLAGISGFIGFILRKNIAEGKLNSAESQAEKILEDARKNAERDVYKRQGYG